MKKRMWFWCLIASLSLALNVACDEDTKDELPTPPPTDGVPTEPIPSPETIWVDSIEVLNTELTIGYEGGEIEFVTRTNQTWQIDIQTADGKGWLTVTDPGRAVADYTVKVAATKNVSKNERTATIYLLFDDAEDSIVEVTVTQEGRPMTATIPLEVELPEGNHINVASNYNIADLIEGCDTDMEPQLGYLNDEGDYVWQNWTVTDGWFGPDGPMDWGTGCIICLKPSTDGSFSHISTHPSAAVGTEITAYINYGNDIIVEVHGVVTGQVNEDETEYTVVGKHEVAFETSFASGYGGGTHSIDSEIASSMASAIGLSSLSAGTWVMLKADETVAGGDNLGGTNGWYGVDGPTSWGNNSIVFLNNDGGGAPASWNYGCHPDIAQVGDVVTVRIEFRNPDNGKAVRYYATITVVA